MERRLGEEPTSLIVGVRPPVAVRRVDGAVRVDRLDDVPERVALVARDLDGLPVVVDLDELAAQEAVSHDSLCFAHEVWPVVEIPALFLIASFIHILLGVCWQ